MAVTIEEAFQASKFRDIGAIIEGEIAGGAAPYDLIRRCQQAMEEVGRRFESGQSFLAELMLSARMFETAASILAPLLKPGEAAPRLGKIVLGTPRGDIHDLGKNIFSIMAQAGGFEVVDLGIDVAPERFVEAVKETNAGIVGLSALITTTYPSMKSVVKALTDAALRDKVKIIIGGGATGEEAKRFVGADAQTLDAAAGVRICANWMRTSDALTKDRP
jgi:methylmalonyl-CoA mutase cobalamin-binding domain/chain